MLKIVFKDRSVRRSSRIRRWQADADRILNYRSSEFNELIENIVINAYRRPEVFIMDSDGFEVDPRSLYTGETFKDKEG